MSVWGKRKKTTIFECILNLDLCDLLCHFLCLIRSLCYRVFGVLLPCSGMCKTERGADVGGSRRMEDLVGL